MGNGAQNGDLLFHADSEHAGSATCDGYDKAKVVRNQRLTTADTKVYHVLIASDLSMVVWELYIAGTIIFQEESREGTPVPYA